MEFRQEDIARLVIGYLKREGCTEALNAFAQGSQYLKKYTHKILNGKHFLTRVFGMTLIDYLTEYAIIYTLVQERLEDTNFHQENGVRCSLLKQLLYLLGSAGDAPAVSPRISDSSLRNHERSFDQFQDGLKATHQSSLTESSTKLVSVGVNTTPLDSLPGNVGEKSPRRRTRANKSTGGTSSGQETSEEAFDVPVEVLSQTLLEHKELPQKLALYINKGFSNLSASAEEKAKPSIGQELDVAIKSIVEKTEADPLFDRLIEEIIGSADEVNTNEADPPIQEATLNTPLGKTEQLPSNAKQQKCSVKKLDGGDALMNHYQLDKSQQLVNVNQPQIQPNFQPFIYQSPATAQLSIITQPSSSVPSTASNQCVLIQSGVQQSINAQQAIIISEGPPLVEQKPCGSGGTNVHAVQQQSQYQPMVQQQPLTIAQTTTFTEDDILGMPMYICDTKPPATGATTAKKGRGKRTSKSEQNQTLSQFISTYKADAQTTPSSIADSAYSLLAINPANPQRTYHIRNPFARQTRLQQQKQQQQQLSQQIQILDVKCIPPAMTRSASGTSTDTTPMPALVKIGSKKEVATKEDKKQQELKKQQHATPEVKVDKVKKAPRSTPRSASHVRQLNFSTPDKFYASSGGAPVIEVLSSEKEKSRECSPEPTEAAPVETVKESSNWLWDAELRALTAMPQQAPASTVKRKQRSLSPASDAKRQKLEPSSATHGSVVVEEIVVASGGGRAKSLPPVEEDARTVTISIPDDDDEVEVEAGSSKVPSPAHEIILETIEIPSPDASPNGDFEMINTTIKPKTRKKCNVDAQPKKTLETTENIVVMNLGKGDETWRTSSACDGAATKTNVIQISVDESVAALLAPMRAHEVKAPEEKTVLKMPAKSKAALPVMETPIKYDPVLAPKTPGIFSPNTSLNTPFTKAVIEQLHGIDIGAIPTPKFPITPSIPITPALAIESAQSGKRATDYSTTSSYYQPSDNEQSKSLEQLMEEFERMDKQQRVGPKEMGEEILAEAPRKPRTPTTVEKLRAQPGDSGVGAMAKERKTAIASKNLNLLAPTPIKNANYLSDISQSSFDSSSTSSTSSTSSSPSDGNDTVICQDVDSRCARKDVRKPKNDGDAKLFTRKTPRKLDTTSCSSVENRPSPERPRKKCVPYKSYKLQVHNDIEEKRLRTISKFKEEEAGKRSRKPSMKALEWMCTTQLRSSTKRTMAGRRKKMAAKGKMVEVPESPRGKKGKTRLKKKSPRSTRKSPANKGKTAAKCRLEELNEAEIQREKEIPAVAEPEVPEKTCISPASIVAISAPDSGILLENDGNVTSGSECLRAIAELEEEQGIATIARQDDDEQMVKELGERGIYLVPKKKMIAAEVIPAIVIEEYRAVVESKINETEEERITETSSSQNRQLEVETKDLKVEKKDIKVEQEDIKVEQKDTKVDKKDVKLDKKDEENRKKSKHSSDSQKSHREKTEMSHLREDKYKYKVSESSSKSKRENSTTKTVTSKKNDSKHKDERKAKEEKLKHESSRSSSKESKKSSSKEKEKKKIDTKPPSSAKEENKQKTDNPKLPTPKSLSLIKSTESTRKPDSKLLESALINPSSLKNRREVIFDVQSFPMESHSYTHNNLTVPTRHLHDYDFTSINRNLQAKVYVEELDGEIPRTMRFTAMDFLLDIPPKAPIMDKSSRVERSSPGTKNPIMDKPSRVEKPSPPATKHPIMDKTSTPKKPSPPAANVVKVADVEKSKKKLKIVRKQERKASVEEIRKREAKMEVQETQTKTEASNLPVENVVEKLMESPQTMAATPYANSPRTSDDLMNFALVGSVDSEQEMKSKRKSDSEGPPEKKLKAVEMQVLLKRMNVDMFLENLHKKS